MQKVSLAVMRIQPLHKGHEILIRQMLKSTQKALIAIGSTQESKTEKNPFTYEQRVEMLKIIFEGENYACIPLIDIYAKKRKEWVDYVLNEAKKSGFKPTCYYSGSLEDASWFNGFLPLRIVDRKTTGFGINGSNIRKDIQNSQEVSQKIKNYIKKNMHVMPKLFW